MTIDIAYETEEILDIDYEPLIQKVILEAVDYEKCPFECEVNVVLTDNNEIHQVNKEYRQIDRPTDVLSFPMVEYEKPGDFSKVYEMDDCFNPETGELLLGDIMISVDKIKEQAKAYGHSLERELGFLVAHSMLHLFGYDHMEDKERDLMELRQSEILSGIGLTR